MDCVQTIQLKLPKIPTALFAPLLGKGVCIRVRTGESLEALLCDQLDIAPDYVRHRIQTILVNGRPVDDISGLFIREGDVIAISAAMPGLVGTTLRKGGHLAAMRAAISHNSQGHAPADHSTGMVTLKLFNMVARELAAHILSRGIWLSHRDASQLLPLITNEPPPLIAAEADHWVQLCITTAQ